MCCPFWSPAASTGPLEGVRSQPSVAVENTAVNREDFQKFSVAPRDAWTYSYHWRILACWVQYSAGLDYKQLHQEFCLKQIKSCNHSLPCSMQKWMCSISPTSVPNVFQSYWFEAILIFPIPCLQNRSSSPSFLLTFGYTSRMTWSVSGHCGEDITLFQLWSVPVETRLIWRKLF